MNIKELTETVGLSRDTIRFYEREGLISKPSRKSNGYRDYDNKIVEQLNMIVMAKELGFTLKEIRELTEPPRLYRRVFYLSQAAMPDRVKLS